MACALEIIDLPLQTEGLAIANLKGGSSLRGK